MIGELVYRYIRDELSDWLRLTTPSVQYPRLYCTCRQNDRFDIHILIFPTYCYFISKIYSCRCSKYKGTIDQICWNTAQLELVLPERRSESLCLPTLIGAAACNFFSIKAAIYASCSVIHKTWMFHFFSTLMVVSLKESWHKWQYFNFIQISEFHLLSLNCTYFIIKYVSFNRMIAWKECIYRNALNTFMKTFMGWIWWNRRLFLLIFWLLQDDIFKYQIFSNDSKIEMSQTSM